MIALKRLSPIPVPRLARFLAVIAIAMAAGHLVQSLAARKPAIKAAAVIGMPQGIVQLSASSTVLDIRAPLPALPMDIVAVSGAATEMEPLPQAQVATAPDCQVDLALDSQPAAMIGVLLLAPCHAGERVVLRHAGLAFTARLGADGKLQHVLPGLVSEARVEIMFADGETVDGALDMPEAAALRRFGVQWQGSEAFVVHGFQNGADFGEPGHISPAYLGRPDGGQLVLLGDSTVDLPLLAQIYTFPATRGQSAEVMIEAAVTAATCGHELLGETIASGANQVQITELTLAMPDCSGIGDFLVLKNLASDMKIAAN